MRRKLSCGARGGSMAGAKKFHFHCASCGVVGGCNCQIPPLGTEREPQGGCYVIVCEGCDSKLYSPGRSGRLACICPHCGAWLEFTWPVPYNSVPLVGKQKGKP
jgi:hypothetical protein